MKETLITIGLIVSVMGTFALIALTPLVVRDGLKKWFARKRLVGFNISKISKLPIVVESKPTRESSGLFYKESLSRRNGILISSIFTLWMVAGILVGVYALYQKCILGEEVKLTLRMIQMCVAAYAMYNYHIVPFLNLKAIKNSQEWEISEMTTVFKCDHILVSQDGVSNVVSWSEVDYVKIVDENYVFLIFKDKGSHLVSKFDDFESGSFGELLSFLKPLVK